MAISRSATFDDAQFCNCEPEQDGEPGIRGGRCVTCGKRVLTDELQAEVDELARRWSQLHTEIEHEGFDRQARWEDGAYEDDYTPEQLAAHQMRRQLKERARQTELETIEAMLAERGARMMRPYEHWNEDERYMSWAEGEG